MNKKSKRKLKYLSASVVAPRTWLVALEARLRDLEGKMALSDPDNPKAHTAQDMAQQGEGLSLQQMETILQRLNEGSLSFPERVFGQIHVEHALSVILKHIYGQKLNQYEQKRLEIMLKAC